MNSLLLLHSVGRMWFPFPSVFAGPHGLFLRKEKVKGNTFRTSHRRHCVQTPSCPLSLASFRLGKPWLTHKKKITNECQDLKNHLTQMVPQGCFLPPKNQDYSNESFLLSLPNIQKQRTYWILDAPTTFREACHKDTMCWKFTCCLLIIFKVLVLRGQSSRPQETTAKSSEEILVEKMMRSGSYYLMQLKLLRNMAPG